MTTSLPPNQRPDEIQPPFAALLNSPAWQQAFARWLAGSETFAELEARRRRLPAGHVDFPGRQRPEVSVSYTVTLQANSRGLLDGCSTDGRVLPADARVTVIVPDDCGDCGAEYGFLESLAVHVLGATSVEVQGPAGSLLVQRIADAIASAAAREAGAACRAA